MDYENVPSTLGALISRGMASPKELQEYYSIEDVYDMLEIIVVDNYNKSLDKE